MKMEKVQGGAVWLVLKLEGERMDKTLRYSWFSHLLVEIDTITHHPQSAATDQDRRLLEQA